MIILAAIVVIGLAYFLDERLGLSLALAAAFGLIVFLAKIDFAIIIISLGAYFLGSKHNFIRKLLMASLVGSSLFYVLVDWANVVQSLDPDIFYYNFALSAFLCGLAIWKPLRHARVAGVTFFFTAIINYMCFAEFYLRASIVYDNYSWAMVALATWQIWLLIRIGDVGGNAGRKFRSWLPAFVGPNADHHLDSAVSWLEGDERSRNRRER